MIICDDLNINSLTESAEKQNLEIIMNMFNLTQVVTSQPECVIIKVH